jgi:hypothetical protein
VYVRRIVEDAKNEDKSYLSVSREFGAFSKKEKKYQYLAIFPSQKCFMENGKRNRLKLQSDLTGCYDCFVWSCVAMALRAQPVNRSLVGPIEGPPTTLSTFEHIRSRLGDDFLD